MRIGGFQKLTLLDYPDKTACIIFTQGCNFNCSYCHNSELIVCKEGTITEDYIFDYLDKRKNIIDGVVISGGEPTIQKDLINFIKIIKEKGFFVKLDTNGTNPKVLKELLDNHLLDYVAMDIKTTFDEYKEVTKCKVNINSIKRSIEIIMKGNIDYEFRTTIIKGVHDISKILKICEIFPKKYYIQNFRLSENVVDKNLESFSVEELAEIRKILEERFSDVVIREE